MGDLIPRVLARCSCDPAARLTASSGIFYFWMRLLSVDELFCALLAVYRLVGMRLLELRMALLAAMFFDAVADTLP